MPELPLGDSRQSRSAVSAKVPQWPVHEFTRVLPDDGVSERECCLCGSSFDVFTWKYRCFRCDEWYCEAHLTTVPRAEARRRFGLDRPLHVEGEGACKNCDAQRVTAVKDGLRDALADGDDICVGSDAGDDGFVMATEYRISGSLTVENETYAVLVPRWPWDTELSLLRLTAGAERTFVSRDDTPAVLGRGLASRLKCPALPDSVSDADATRFAVQLAEAIRAWKRSQWLGRDLEDRIGWVMGSAAGPWLSSPAELAQAVLDLTHGQIEPDQGSGAGMVLAAAGGVAAIGMARAGGRLALRAAAPWVGLAALAVAALSVAAEDTPPIRVFRAKAKEVAGATDMSAARTVLAKAAHELAKSGVGAGPPTPQQQAYRSLANMALWLAQGQRGALLDATNDAEPLPLATWLPTSSPASTRCAPRVRGAQVPML